MLLPLERLRLGRNRHLLGKQVNIHLQPRQGREFHPSAVVIRSVKPQFFYVAAAYPQRIVHHPAGPQIPTRGVIHGDGQPLDGVGGAFSAG